MGIDIEFQAVIPKIVTEQEAEELLTDMHTLFNAKERIDKIRILDQKFIDSIYDDNFKIPEGHTVLDFYTLCRLYAKEYARGYPIPWMIYADYLEWRYPGSYVSYTGDCSKCIYSWTKEDREELKRFYFENGTRPYDK